MNHTDHRRMLTHAGRVLLSAALVAALTLVAPPPPALAAVSFTDLGNVGITPISDGEVAWGDYDADGDLDLVVAGLAEVSSPDGVTLIYRNDGGTFTDIGAGVAGVRDGAVAWGDYDADGDLDLATAGNEAGLVCSARIYHNAGGTFSDIGAGLQGCQYASLAWGDYDGDGDLDLVVAGDDGSYVGRYTRLYRNDHGTFVDANAGLPGISGGTVAWGDYDNDGDLDLLLTGFGYYRAISQVWRNDGGTFVDAGAGLLGMENSRAAWGDYDADGDLDIVVVGVWRQAGTGVPDARVYRNDGGTFTDIGAGLPKLCWADVAWGDYDNDGDLDILLSGSYSPSKRIAAVYAYNAGKFADAHLHLHGLFRCAVAWGDYDSDGDLDALYSGWDGTATFLHLCRSDGAPANTPPSAPSGLTATVDGATANLGWSAATDAQTPAAGLTYNLRVGTAPGAADVVAPMADLATGRRWLPQMGNAGHGTTARLTLGPGTYYWCVQAIDSAFAGGPFAAEASFTIAAPAVAPASASIAGPAVGGAGASLTFTATVSPAETTLPLTYTWQATAQGTVTHTEVQALQDAVAFTWPLAGPQAVTVTVSNAAGSAQGAHALTIYAPPVAGFDAAPVAGIAPLAVTFTNTTTGEYTTSLWTFGDGITSTLTSPLHTYEAGGAYTVTLAVEGPGGSDAITRTDLITVYAPLLAGFEAAPRAGIAPLAVVFTNTTSGDFDASLWAFGDGITSTLESPTHTYDLPGVYTVSLTVEGPTGSDTLTRTDYITAYTPVQAGFSAAPLAGTVPLTVTFTNSSTGDFETSLWDLGDGITSTLESPTHTYGVPGVYAVSLTVEGPGGVDTAVVTDCIHAFPALPDPGPLRSDLVLENLGQRPAAVNLVYAAESGGPSRRYNLDGRIPALGWQRVTAPELEPAESAAWAGSATVLATQPLASLVELAWDYPLGPRTAAAYPRPAPATEAYLPCVAAATGRLTLVTIQNLEAAEQTVTLRIYDRHGVEALVHQVALPARATRTLSLAELAPDLSATAGLGTARVTGQGQVAAVAALHWVDASEAYAAAPAGDTLLWLPGVVRRQIEGWNEWSEAAIQNAGTLTASVTVDFLNPDGTVAHSLTDEIAPRGGACYSTASQGTLDPATWQALVAALGAYWRGTVRVTSGNGQPLAGLVVGGSADVADHTGHSATPAGSATGRGLAFPSVHRLPSGEGERWSVVQVQNSAATAGTLAVAFYDAGGARIGDTYTIALPALGSVRLDLKAGGDLPPEALAALGSDFSGAMVVTPSTGVTIVGACQTYWVGEGRAAGYAGFALP